MLSKLRQQAKKIDMFSTAQFLRYREQTEYGTLSGACLSVGIVVVIFLLVYQVLLHTINKDEVTWSMTTSKEIAPADHTIKLSEMKFGINIIGADLTHPSKSFFDVKAQVETTVSFKPTNTTEIALSKCTAEDWSETEQTQEVYSSNRGFQWMCPDPSFDLTIGGRLSSSNVKTMNVYLYPCGSIDTNKTNCASDTEMDRLFTRVGGSLSMLLMMVNPLIQPDELNPVSSYVEDSFFVTFSPTFGEGLNIQLSQYTIQTDHSLLPFTSIETQTGTILSERTTSFLIARADNTSEYASFRVQKSPSKLSYKRSFNKIDDTVSYAGGLIGVIVGLFFILSPYTQLSFELSLANRLFSDEDGKQLKTSINFFKYIGYGVYNLLNLCCKCVDWPQYAIYERSSEQVQKELDISYLLRRINTLEEVVSADRDLKQHFEEGYRSMTIEQSDSKSKRANKEPPHASQSMRQKTSSIQQNQFSIAELNRVNSHPLEDRLEASDNGIEISRPVRIRPSSHHSEQRPVGQSQTRRRRRHNKRQHQDESNESSLKQGNEQNGQKIQSDASVFEYNLQEQNGD